MYFKVFIISILILSVTVIDGRKHRKGVKKSKGVAPPHCTHLTKDTDFVSRFKFTYPIALIAQGHHEAYQQLFCVNPSAVNKAVTSVCDWAAPPQVQFTMGDEYLHVIRQDPTGQFSGNAVITTYQFCSHNISHHTVQGEKAMPFVTQF